MKESKARPEMHEMHEMHLPPFLPSRFHWQLPVIFQSAVVELREGHVRQVPPGEGGTPADRLFLFVPYHQTGLRFPPACIFLSLTWIACLASEN